MQGKDTRRVAKKVTSSQNSQQATESINTTSSAPIADPNLYEIFGISDPHVAHITQPVAPIASAPFRIRDVQIHLSCPRTSDCGGKYDIKGRQK